MSALEKRGYRQHDDIVGCVTLVHTARLWVHFASLICCCLCNFVYSF